MLTPDTKFWVDDFGYVWQGPCACGPLDNGTAPLTFQRLEGAYPSGMAHWVWRQQGTDLQQTSVAVVARVIELFVAEARKESR